MTASLKREEILRGFGIIEEVLSNSKKLSTDVLAAHLNFSDEVSGLPVKVGFMLSKKKLKKLTTGTGSGVC